MMQKLRALKSHALLIARTLTEFNRARVELAIHWLKKSTPTTFVLNVFVFSVLAMVKYRAKFKAKWAEWRNVKPPQDLSQYYDVELPLRVAQEKLRVLIIAETSIPQCLCYRVQQKQDQLAALGWHCEIMPWYDPEACKQRMHFHDVILFYRVPGLPKPLEMIEFAQSLRKLVVYDVDDLIFDQARLKEKFAAQPEQLSNKEFKNILDGADLYRAAIEACSYAITTTPTLQRELAALVKEKQCFVLPNAISRELYDVLTLPKARQYSDKVTILYGSGTRTHDEDFALIADVLAQMLDKYDNLHLALMGYLTLPDSLSRYEDRIQRVPMMDFASYLMCLRQADISIAPLESGVFADAKSEIKWMEAAALGVPSVVSYTDTYAQVIEHEKTGYIARDQEDWWRYLDALIADSELRGQIAEQAKQAVMQKYAIEPMAQSMQDILLTIQEHAINNKTRLAKQDRPVKVLFVNVLYAPASVGGATIVMENLVNGLHAQYGDQFEVSVVMSDVVGTMVNNVREYGWKGVNVTGVGVSMEGDFELNHHSQKTKEIFAEIIDQQRPDIIHYHCIQRLTGAVVEVARERDIPYFVTVHDGWWLSEYQFMLDDDKALIDPRQLNPLIAINSASKPAESIERTRYLASLLNDAQSVFAVSDYQAGIYQDNGFDNVLVHKNGVSINTDAIRPESNSTQLRIGYLGGICDHKGYHFMKSVFEQNEFGNLSLTVVDIFEERDYFESQRWGATQADHVGQFKPEEIAEFYNNIDVFIAPSIWPESFGLVTREASLYGVWVIAASAGGLAEDVIDGQTGWVFEMNDKPGLQQILADLNANAEKFIDNKPDVSLVSASIQSVQRQVDELAAHYHQLGQKELTPSG